MLILSVILFFPEDFTYTFNVDSLFEFFPENQNLDFLWLSSVIQPRQSVDFFEFEFQNSWRIAPYFH